MTQSPVDPAHDDHGDDHGDDPAAEPAQSGGDTGENPDGSHDQDAKPPTAR